jgi:hypothetical protein
MPLLLLRSIIRLLSFIVVQAEHAFADYEYACLRQIDALTNTFELCPGEKSPTPCAEFHSPVSAPDSRAPAP